MEKEKKMAEDKTMGKHLAARRKTSHHKRQFPSPPQKKSQPQKVEAMLQKK